MVKQVLFFEFCLRCRTLKANDVNNGQEVKLFTTFVNRFLY